MANIGKNIIDIITFNLYDNPKAIFREYIQNSADAIDNAIELNILSDTNEYYINITLEKDERTIIIEDNATGIKKEDIEKNLIDIACSDKDRKKNKGFFGIGRLTGLGYCEKLIFETSYFGENIKTIVELNSADAHEIIYDTEDHSNAEEVINRICSVECFSEKEEEHYFRVKLEGVHKVANDELLDKKAIRNYLQLVAPIGFDRSFQMYYTDSILPYVKENNLNLDTYNIWVNNETIKKPYNTSLYDKNDKKLENDEIKSLKFMEFYTNEGELLAWGWHSISNFDGQIPNSYKNRARGIRFRKHNIQIGSEETLKKYYKEDRGYAYFIGEVHVVHKDLLPNSQRNDFTQNSTYQIFQEKLKEKFLELFEYYQEASKFRSACVAIEKVDLLEKKLTTEKFIDKEAKEKLIKEIEDTEKIAIQKKKFLEKKEKELGTDSTMGKIFNNIVGPFKEQNNKKITFPNEHDGLKINEKGGYIFEELTKLSRAEIKLITKVFSIISKNLPDKKLVNVLAKKIIDEFK